LWRHPIDSTRGAALLSADGARLYVLNSRGLLEAFEAERLGHSLGAEPDADDLTPLWTLKLDRRGTPSLLPLGERGVLVLLGAGLVGVSPDSEIAWEREGLGYLRYWTVWQDSLLLALQSRTPALWSAYTSGPVRSTEVTGGQPVAAGNCVWVADVTGVYRVDPETLSAQLALPLPRAYLDQGDALALPDGGALLARVDVSDERLIRLGADGTLRWQRSYRGRLSGEQRLLVVADRVWLVSIDDAFTSSTVTVFAVDVEAQVLAKVFTGSTRQPRGETTVIALDDRYLLVDLGGVSLTLLDPVTALYP
jgi:hypothetical protein